MKRKLTIVSIGPGDPSLLNQVTLDQLRTAAPLILRTDHHPLVSWLDEQEIRYLSLDDLYEQSDDFDELSGRIADRVWQLVSESKHPVFAVPDILTDSTVDCVFSRRPESAAEIVVIPGFSYADFYLSRCRELLPAGSFRVVSATGLLSSDYDPAEPLLVTEIDQATLAGDLKVFLSSRLDDEAHIWLLRDSGKPRAIPLFELDRLKHYNHMTALFLPAVDFMHRSRFTLRDLEEIMERLRAPDGCPWDRIQTHESLQPYMVEEAWESVIAMDEGDPDHMADELGDLLFQIVFHASIGKAFDEFSMNDVISHICTKMIQRHPHVFGSAHYDSPQDVADRWETIKREETGSRTVSESLNDVSPALPSLKYAIKVNKKAMQFPAWRSNTAELAGVIRNLSSRLADDHGALSERIMGKLLFLCTYLCHLNGQDSEIILHKTVNRFKKCFETLENNGFFKEKSPESLTFSELCVYLNHVEEEIE